MSSKLEQSFCPVKGVGDRELFSGGSELRKPVVPEDPAGRLVTAHVKIIVFLLDIVPQCPYPISVIGTIMKKEGTMTPEKYRNSKQRTRILELLSSTRSHPTASWIYDTLKPEFPSLSLGTVYRNLNILEELGTVIKISSGSTFDRYDAALHPHAHFRCTKCGRVYDMDDPDVDTIMETAQEKTSHAIETAHIEFRGLCSPCREEQMHKAQNG